MGTQYISVPSHTDMIMRAANIDSLLHSLRLAFTRQGSNTLESILAFSLSSTIEKTKRLGHSGRAHGDVACETKERGCSLKTSKVPKMIAYLEQS